MTEIAALISEVKQFPIDRETMAQERLDLDSRSRTSLFPWRGQFSPELIEHLLSEYAASARVVADPFVGSGTTLFECARKSLTCFGAEINPAAVQMASTVHFVNVQPPERSVSLLMAQAVMEKHLPAERNLFSWQDSDSNATQRSVEEVFHVMLDEASQSPLVHNVIANTVIRYGEAQGANDADLFRRAFHQHRAVVEQLPYSPNPCRVLHCDARRLPLDDQSVDFIITSPPYINVFNYHQNYRSAMELMGWNLLRVAKSEIGSNRKHRGNRFLTVVQYALDMLQSLCGMRRLLRPTGRVIIVIGRESNVRGMRFHNYQILAALACGGAGLRLTLRQERKFLNRFGETIYEDLLHFAPDDITQTAPSDFARELAIHFLEEAVRQATGEVKGDVLSAIRVASHVQPSPLFEPATAISSEGKHGANAAP
jgi:methylase of polypeptide subunit release factors